MFDADSGGVKRAPAASAVRASASARSSDSSGADGSSESSQVAGYSNQDNPWNDPNLAESFVWGKKAEKDLKEAEARGKGVGTKLLQWAEAQAVARGDTVMSLAVLRGNRAQGLYQRFGFEEQPHQDGCDECCECCFVTLCFGRPYGE